MSKNDLETTWTGRTLARRDRSYFAVLAGLGILLFGCLPGSNPDDVDRELDEAEAERLGCPGAYVYDWKRNCRYQSKKLCELEFVACQDTEIRNAYDVDGTCWRFNTCIPDAAYWPATEGDVCDHQRSEVPFCDDAVVDCDIIETQEQCEDAVQCEPALGYEWDATNECTLSGFAPRYLGCVPASDDCEELELKELGDGCILTSVCSPCPGDRPCEPCEVPETFESCDQWTARLFVAEFDPSGTSAPELTELTESAGTRPDQCIPAALGEARWLSGDAFFDEPQREDPVWWMFVPVQNLTDSETCGFEGANVKVVVEPRDREPAALEGSWPAGLGCSENTWIAVELSPAPTISSYDISLSAVDSCGSGGGTIVTRAD